MAKRRPATRPSPASRSVQSADWAFHADDAAVLDALVSGRHAQSLREYFGTPAYAQLRERGAHFVMPPTEQANEGIRLAVCMDPDGLSISFAEALAR